MEPLYVLGFKATACILSLIFIIWIIIELVWLVRAFIDDDNDSTPLTSGFLWGVEYQDFIHIIFAGIPIIAICAFVWPITVPIIILTPFIFAARKFVRFKKQIKKLLDNKSDIDHQHTT